ncbi:MAG TPA: ABC transporter ATP-binding protein [Phycisphaerae bacterium]|nr:ABC transporter ATP-binding protein [Phycisphaerae bacterium]HOJ72762.1 ABC transporter ATP-binding protein [Phycisphaerae bacterium]HOM51811.1 ABC transporter ATP-binding protein [Phycisphaerae bacterium]HON65197.1 ABC transporter ATP-binding protein [Phycisphaerae bacterium]HOQ84389.1 ABC transporter ATP-binding protein [Phycisphaerae bacterium]
MADSLLQVEDLSYTYPDGTHALQGINLSLSAGEKVGLVGPNGSGKSTLLLCLAGLVFGRGRITFAGEPLTPQRVREVRGRIGLVFQSADDQLFMPSLAEDLAFGPTNLGLPADLVRQRVQRVADRMGLSHMLERPPHHLSMGQRRNAAVAGVLVMQPELLLMDEPASNLDPRSRRRLIETLSSLPMTLLIASHDLAMVAGLCSRAVLIDQGRVVADGPTETILHDGPLMERHGLEAWHGARP